MSSPEILVMGFVGIGGLLIGLYLGAQILRTAVWLVFDDHEVTSKAMVTLFLIVACNCMVSGILFLVAGSPAGSSAMVASTSMKFKVTSTLAFLIVDVGILAQSFELSIARATGLFVAFQFLFSPLTILFIYMFSLV